MAVVQDMINVLSFANKKIKREITAKNKPRTMVNFSSLRN